MLAGSDGAGLAAVARPYRSDHPEPVQGRLVEQRREPCAEDAGVDQADHFAGTALLVVKTGQAVHRDLPEIHPSRTRMNRSLVDCSPWPMLSRGGVGTIRRCGPSRPTGPADGC